MLSAKTIPETVRYEQQTFDKPAVSVSGAWDILLILIQAIDNEIVMIRKILFGAVAVIFIAVLVYAFLELKKGNIRKVDIIQAVPTDAAIIVNAQNISVFIHEELSGNKMWEELTALPGIDRMNRILFRLDTLMREDDEISGLYRSMQASVSLHRSGKSNYDFVLYCPLENTGNEKQIIRFILEGVPDGSQISNRKYNDVRIYDVQFPRHRDRDNFSFVISHGLFVLSPSSILLEESIRQMELPQSLADEPCFHEVAGTAGRNVEGNIYINYKTFPDFIGHLINDRFSGKVPALGHFSKWSELDINLRHDAVLLNGFTCPEKASDDYLNIVLKHQPRKMDIENVVPSTVAAFLAMGFDNFQTYKKDYIKYLEAAGEGRAYLRDLRAFNEKYKMDVDQELLPLIDGQAALVITDIRNSDWDDNCFVICRTRSQSLAEEKLIEFLGVIAGKDGIDPSSLIIRSKINNDVNHTFYQLPVPFLPMKLLGRFFEGANSKYCTFYDQTLIFGNSIDVLSKYIHASQLGDNLGSDLDFSRLSEYLASRSNLYLYLNIPSSGKLRERFLDPGLVKKYQEKEEHFSKFQAIALQLTSENDLAYNNIVLKYTPEMREDAQTVWESRMDRPVITKPGLVVNHNTGEKEIFVQDAGHNIYLMNNTGRILWKQKIEGEILSDVFQVDYYKNGKLQLIFNTRDQLHLIDRNGNYVERYPVKLRSPATNGMALFDYEKNRDYRIFVAGEDRGIYLYNKEGSIVQGWDFRKTEGRVTKPLQHFRLGNRDYLVCADELTTYILNRKGQARVRVEKHFPVARNAEFILERTGTKPRLAVTDTTGRVQFIYFDGMVEQADLGRYSGNHYFAYSDLDGDGKQEYIFADGTELKVFAADKSRVFSHSFRSNISQPPVIYQFSYGNMKIGLVCDERHEIYLLNNDGSMYSGFPLRGSTPFSIGVFKSSASKFNLVVGSEDNFLYNYSVQ